MPMKPRIHKKAVITLAGVGAMIILAVVVVRTLNNRARTEWAIREVERVGGLVGVVTSFGGHPRRISFQVGGRTSTLDDATLTQILSVLTDVEDLNLSSTKITNQGLTVLSTLEYLEYLSIADTAINDSGVAILQQCQSVRDLDLRFTGITSTGSIGILCKMQHLSVLRVDSVTFDVDDIRLLESSLPTTRIIVD